MSLVSKFLAFPLVSSRSLLSASSVLVSAHFFFSHKKVSEVQSSFEHDIKKGVRQKY